MHELPIITNVLKLVIKQAETNKAQKVISISLTVGELRDLENEWMQRFFDFVSKDTIAIGAVLKIERSPVLFRCAECNESFPVKIREVKNILCPICNGGKVTLISGDEFSINQMEIM
jgi:hydrogenase nickel incorporation protein HypA/HybF